MNYPGVPKISGMELTETMRRQAEDFGAEMLVTSCPLCRYNLIKSRKDSNLDVIYFSELLAEALGIKDSVLASLNGKESVNA